ncbi:MAG: hypothetical protein R3B06_11955 [Kofleriaceae bacterium]
MPITTWGRLEPDIEALDPAAGLARGLAGDIADPLWLLGQQLALGELRGEDGGVPVSADLVMEHHTVTALTIGGVLRTLEPGVPWESLVEAEPDQVDLRLRIRGGELFVALLEEAGLGDALGAARDALGWLDPEVGMDAGAIVKVVTEAARRWPDGARLADACRAGKLATALQLRPDQLAAGDEVGTQWYAWWSSRAHLEGPSAWQPAQLEHSFAAQVATGAGALTLAAASYPGGRLDWAAFEVAASDPSGAVPAAPTATTSIPVPLQIPGMPTSRVWELEDDVTELTRLTYGPGELGTALLLEVALGYASDWFVVPVELASGGLHRVASLHVTDSFGVRSISRPADVVRPDPAWSLWRLTGDAAGWLLVPEVTAETVMGEAIEEVAVIRDELANTGWAIERVVADALGRGRRATPRPAPPPPTTVADWRYAPLPQLPGDRVPLVRRATAEGGRLVRAGVVDPIMDVPATAGRVVTADFAVREVDLGRLGAVVTRRWQLALDASGARRAWCTRARVPAQPAAGLRVAFDDLRANLETPAPSP